MVSRCFPGGYNIKLYISRGRLAWWLLAFFVLCQMMAGWDIIHVECNRSGSDRGKD